MYGWKVSFLLYMQKSLMQASSVRWRIEFSFYNFFQLARIIHGAL